MGFLCKYLKELFRLQHITRQNRAHAHIIHGMLKHSHITLRLQLTNPETSIDAKKACHNIDPQQWWQRNKTTIYFPGKEMLVLMLANRLKVAKKNIANRHNFLNDAFGDLNQNKNVALTRRIFPSIKGSVRLSIIKPEVRKKGLDMFF